MNCEEIDHAEVVAAENVHLEAYCVAAAVDCNLAAEVHSFEHNDQDHEAEEVLRNYF